MKKVLTGSIVMAILFVFSLPAMAIHNTQPSESTEVTPAPPIQHKHGGSEMGMHHMHMLMGHGITMVVEGSNMAMLAQMKMAPGVD
ncbi:MAG: hypothetical protein ACLPX5_05890, partial [Dissulfurispiraceae bacterium]